MSEPTTTVPQGFVCSLCGVWIPPGEDHACNVPDVGQTFIKTPTDESAFLFRIAAAMERIADVLERRE